MSEVDK